MPSPVFVTRHGTNEGRDFFPTPPWATRAICEAHKFEGSIWEPACGDYHMSNTLKEYNDNVTATDLIYGHDFLLDKPLKGMDWIITNPPFNMAEEFIHKSLEYCNRGAAFLLRINFLATAKRYRTLYSITPPAKIFQYTDRIQFNATEVNRKGSTAVDYTWIIWDKQHNGPPEFNWLPPNRFNLEKDEDYVHIDKSGGIRPSIE